jgi:hypothetical protein
LPIYYTVWFGVVGHTLMNSTRWTLAIAAAVAMAFFTALVLIPFMTTTLSDGVASYSQGNFAKAYKELKPLADDGEPTAQYMLGEMFRMGQGVKKDEPAAVKWYKKAAEGGSPEGQYALGMCYATGVGTEVDMISAYQWLSLSIIRLASWQNERRTLAAETRAKLLTVMDQSDVEKAKALVLTWDRKFGGS